MRKFAIIPQHDINDLEIARLKLYEMLKNTEYEYELPYMISNTIWKITHTRYPKPCINPICLKEN